MKKLNKGFTLIELLVVIAIIGILSSVVLASLNTARGKGSDAAIKGNLNNTRAQAELFYDTNNTYVGVCGTAAVNGVTGFGAAFNAAASAAGVSTSTTLATAGSATTAVCHESASAWAATVPLKTNTARAWCVDSAGSSKETTHLIASATVCP